MKCAHYLNSPTGCSIEPEKSLLTTLARSSLKSSSILFYHSSSFKTSSILPHYTSPYLYHGATTTSTHNYFTLFHYIISHSRYKNYHGSHIVCRQYSTT